MTHWSERAQCKGYPTELFFPLRDRGGGVEEAKAVCAVCGVRSECLADALATGDTHAVRGGYTAIERRRIEDGARLRRTRCSYCGIPFTFFHEGGRTPNYCNERCAHESRLASQRRSHAKTRSA